MNKSDEEKLIIKAGKLSCGCLIVYAVLGVIAFVMLILKLSGAV